MGANQSSNAPLSDEVGLNHFTLGRVVGKGAFGKVRIVEHKYTKLTFALKYIRKDDIVRSESVRNIIRERRMLEHLNHPFICNLRYSFQDTQYMYLVVDLMSGGDLRFHISRKTFTEEAVKFWIAELGCALRYVHRQGIIHRDVKPDNVLLDSEGHIHLADFNVASDFQYGKPLTSKSGSQPYLSPEVWSGAGYLTGADWWSLGVLFYECIYGKRPFDGNSTKALGESIMAANPTFPVTSPPVSMACMHAISSALEVDPEKRMGHTWNSFIDNPFFRTIDFEALERKEIEPVFIPSRDKTNFDATYDLEELLLEEAPLEARTRKQKPREPLAEGATEKEVREDELYKMIETGFKPFDYTLAAYNRIREAEGNGTTSTGHLGDDLNANRPQTPGRPGSRKGSASYPINVRSPSGRSVASPTGSMAGSPPANAPVRLVPGKNGGYHASPVNYPSVENTSQAPLPKQQRPVIRQPSSQRIATNSGGLSVTFGETGSWSELAKADNTLPADAKLAPQPEEKTPPKPNGMLGFLSRKKGRGHSPKPQERGILGKEGARVVISEG